MIDKELLEGFSRDLGIKSRVVEADIRDLAWNWELVVGRAKVTSPEGIHEILISLAKAYLRGRERRMGNWQGYLRHRYTMTALFLLIVQYVVEEPITFEALHKAGVTGEDAYKAIKCKAVMLSAGLDGDILEEAERILKRKQGNG